MDSRPHAMQSSSNHYAPPPGLPPSPSVPQAYPVLSPSPRPVAAVQAPQQWRPGSSLYLGGSAAPPVISRRPASAPYHHSHPNSSLPSTSAGGVQYNAPMQSQHQPIRHGQSFPALNQVFVESECCCCGTKVRYPKGLDTAAFQCVLCQTINDFTPRASVHRNIPPPHVQPPISPATPFSEDDLKELKDDLAVTKAILEEEGTLELDDDWNPEKTLLERVRTMFGSIRNLDASLRSRGGSSPALETLDTFYEMIVERPRVMEVLREGLEGFLRRPGAHLADGDASWACILLECPILSSKWTPDSEQRWWLISRVLGLISNLPTKLQTSLLHLWSSSTYTKERLESRIDMVNAFISLRIGGSRSMQGGHASDWGVIAGCKVCVILFAANTINRRLPMTAFYCTMLDTIPSDEITASFVSWKQHSQGFSLCQYPFLLSLGIKMNLLAFDGLKQMEEQFTHAFIQSLSTGIIQQPVLVLQVRREQLVRDSLREISTHSSDLKKSLRVRFLGEEGVDAGGVRKEWFLVLVRQLFDPQFGMFVFQEETGLCWFNPASFEAADEFWLIGAVLGLALYNNVTLDVPLPLAVYKKLKNEKVDLRDLASFNPTLAKGLQALLDFEGDVADVFCRTFVGEYEAWGEVQEIPLKENGAEIMVDNDNREEFVRLYVEFQLNVAVQQQFESFAAGFAEVASGDAFVLVKGEEVELLVRGSRDPLDLEQLQAITVYDGFHGAQDPTVKLFWDVFKSLDSTRQRQLLSFITGSDRLPATGTAALSMKLTCMGDDVGRYPTAHTCFNQLCLYRYPTFAVMEDKITKAMDESEGFGLK